ncbi:DUF3859 domain-containing protein [Photobacterium nomapromontoriensis]|uniref:DUF3859 domain-containing protein n=1 Tax=Photobacterium nomapromontoriensis TaxID=2910237 RepID=UPI003D0CAEA9
MKFSKIYMLCIVAALAGCSMTPKTQMTLVEKGPYVANTDSAVELAGLPADKLAVISEISFLENTNVIPAIKGSRFGISYDVTGEDTEVIHKVTFPKMTDPKTGKVIESFTYNQAVTAGNIFFGYYLSEDWEVVPGKWTFSIIHDDEVVVEEVFTLETPVY